MPIARVPYPAALPTVQNDYVLQNDLLITNFYRVNEPSSISGANVTKGAVFQIGGVIYYATADTAIGGAASNYVKISPDVGGATCTATYVANLVGVSWNQAYNGYYDVGGNLYVFDEGRALQAGQIAAVVGRYVMQTRDGDIYVGRDAKIGRDVFGKRNIDIRGDADGDRTITMASDASILWDESENAFIFNKTLGFAAGVAGSHAFAALNETWVIPVGCYLMCMSTTIVLQFGSGVWTQIGQLNGFMYSDGVNYRLKNTYNGANTATYVKLN